MKKATLIYGIAIVLIILLFLFLSGIIDSTILFEATSSIDSSSIAGSGPACCGN